MILAKMPPPGPMTLANDTPNPVFRSRPTEATTGACTRVPVCGSEAESQTELLASLRFTIPAR